MKCSDFGPKFLGFVSFRGIEWVNLAHDIFVNILETQLCLQKSGKISFMGRKAKKCGRFRRNGRVVNPSGKDYRAVNHVHANLSLSARWLVLISQTY